MGKFSLPPDLTQQIDASSDDVLDRMARALSQLNVNLRSINARPMPQATRRTRWPCASVRGKVRQPRRCDTPLLKR
ncbi:MAG: hypothetical protein Q8R98_02580 [Rubrivivax sp.]|nr:hypothetical protein [Rubrivivax sp.]MDP3610716.1 hypothetical protein [Rubrivivax sp.]